MIGIIDYGIGNTKSVQNAIEKIGFPCIISDKKEKLDLCDKIILPGVGSAKSAMKSLKSRDLIDWIKKCEKPLLGICLGMQLLFDSSTEDNCECLKIIPGNIIKFKATKKIPHIGWNNISFQKNSNFNDKYFYFVHSYLAPVGNFTIAECKYLDETFSAIVGRNNFFGTQFHPEKSGDTGALLLAHFLKNNFQ
jgi:glutamine amidotransferase